MATRLPTGVRNAMVDAAVDLADAGAGAGEVRVYTGTQPASANNAASGTLLVTFTLSDPAFGAAASGSASGASMPKSATAAATGTAGWARVVDSNGNAVYDGSVATSGGDFTIDNTSITSGQTVNLTALSFSQPSGE